MGWTRWTKIAEGQHWFDDELDYDGPVIYELSLAGPRGGNREIMYVGKATSEKRRIRSYASNGSHLRKEVNDGLRDGWCLFYRAMACVSADAARERELRMLRKFDYPWNIRDNS